MPTGTADTATEPNGNSLKTCYRCRISKTWASFNRQKSTKDGLHAYCRDCSRQMKAEWYEKNRQHCLDYAKSYASAHEEETKRRRVKYYESMKLSLCYREARRKRCAAWRKKHPDAFDKWAEPRREYLRAESSRRSKLHPERNREQARRYAARKLAAAVGVVDYKEILARDGYTCHICLGIVRPDDVHFDHVIPLSKRGSHSMDNIKVSHSLCNIKKRDRDLQYVWAKWFPYMLKSSEEGVPNVH